MRALVCGCVFWAACTESPAAPVAADAGVDVGVASETHDDVVAVEPEVGSGEDVGSAPDVPLGPLASVWLENPIDSPKTTEVTLLHLTDPDGRLVGEFANVRNCVADKERGKVVTVDPGGIGLQLTLCAPDHTARPGDDGTYLHLRPPETPVIDSDAFAEVMMYHHLQRIHDYFQGLGLTDLDHPLPALVNLQVYLPLCDTWSAFGNALFTPEGSFTYAIEFDFDIDEPAIMFGQTATKDFAYEADVISHEYTHAMVGSTRLNAIFVDEQGLNNLPGALNEAYADYFATSLADESVIGNYALNAVEGLTVCGVPLSVSGNLQRDLTADRRCPDDLTAEVHADGEIFASALWAIREALGPAVADRVILDAVIGFTQATDFAAAAEATIIEAEDQLDNATADKVRQVFIDRGLLGCERVVPAAKLGARLALQFAGGGALGPGPLGDDTPGFVQVGVDVPEGAQEVLLTLQVQGDAVIDGLVKPGGAVKLGGDNGSDAVARLAFDAPSKNTRVLRLSGPCIAGRWSVLVLSRGDDFAVVGATVTAVDAPGEPTVPCGS